MTLSECYAALGGDYDDVMGRLKSERLVRKFVLKFADDGSYSLLCSSLDKGDVQEAFRAAHTLKGTCGNLSFTALAMSGSEMTELLRAGDLDAGRAMLPRVAADYERTLAAIKAYGAGL